MAEILATALNVAAQITDTLSASFPELDKALVAANKKLPGSSVTRTEYLSSVAEMAGVAAHIRQLIASGVARSEIAVLAPKHRYLEPLVPYLDDVPLRCETPREHSGSAGGIRLAAHYEQTCAGTAPAQPYTVASSYWPEVLSYAFLGSFR